MTLSHLDWYQSKIYTSYVLAQAKLHDELESDPKRLREDEINYVKQLVQKRSNEGQMNTIEMQKAVEAYTERAYNTIEFVIREILGEDNYTLEFDKVFLERGFEGNSIRKILYLMDKVRTLFDMREIAIHFLFKIAQREVRLSII